MGVEDAGGDQDLAAGEQEDPDGVCDGVAGQADCRPGRQGGPAAADERGGAGRELLQLTVEERADLQRRLIRLGYDTGREDGTFSTMTRRAIGAWQADEGERVTGYLTADQVQGDLGADGAVEACCPRWAFLDYRSGPRGWAWALGVC